MLDVKDKKILFELDFNARQSNTKIAKKVGLSKEVVNYRIKRLEKLGIITNYYSVINIAKLGFMFCRLFIRFQNVDPKKEQEIIEWAKKHKSIGWIIRTQGPWDIVFIIWAKHINEFRDVTEEICFKYSQFFQSKQVSIATSIYHFKHNYLFDTNDYSSLILGGTTELEDYDDVDTKILGMLSEDGRMSTIDIAQQLSVTPNTIKYRIRELMKKGILQGVRAGIDIRKMGFQRYKVLLVLSNMNKDGFRRLVEFLRCEPNVIYITEAVGPADIEFEIDVRNNEHLNEFMNKVRYEFSDTLKDYTACMTYSEEEINYLPLEKHHEKAGAKNQNEAK
ncbi:Lrp/AsnC family transcriptional regulator [Candidatus Woesearchaeota archaeon]|nr:Lrp/AsnC family transcriptional regulator [Candidatus Woesearchaeota archaeon]